MAAPRSEIPIVVLSEESPTSPVAGATAYVKTRATSELVTVFSDSGATNTAIAQPLTTNSSGMLTGWLPRGAYKVEITVSGKTPYVENLDIAPGSDGAVEASWIASEAVTGAKIAAAIKDAAAGTASLRTLGTGAAQAAAGNDARLSDERTPKATSVTTAKIVDANVTTPKIADANVTEPKIADGAVTSRKVKPTIEEKQLAADFVVPTGGVFELVPNFKVEYKPAVASTIKVLWNLWGQGSTAGSLIEFRIFKNGVQVVENNLITNTSEGGTNQMLNYARLFSAPAGETTIIELRTRGSGSGGTLQKRGGYTNMIAELYAA
jgi:hypothetical protein